MSKKDKLKNDIEDQTELHEDQITENGDSDQDSDSNSKIDKKDKASEKADRVEELENELEKEKDRNLRLFAEFENFRKRTARERIELFKTAGEEIILAMLPVLDDFERALKELEKRDDDNYFTGVKLIHNKLRDTLRTKGLEAIEVNSGDAFDVDTHEAVTKIPAPDKKLKGKIVDVIERGYTLNGKIIRFPKVVVGE